MIAAACAAAAGALALRARAPQLAEVVRLDLSVAPAERLGPSSAFQRPYMQSFAITPDGKRVVFAGRRENTTHLYLRPLAAAEAAEIPGTAGATSPFLSPDGAWVAFLAEGEIRKTPVAGGPVVKVAELAAGGLPSPSPHVPVTQDFFGASWGDDDVIVFGRFADGLWEVPAGGGVPRRLTDAKGGAHGCRASCREAGEFSSRSLQPTRRRRRWPRRAAEGSRASSPRTQRMRVSCRPTASSSSATEFSWRPRSTPRASR